MHVDAFFEYCLGHPHPYYTQLPPPNTTISESRDGVPLEEDLALRALVPEWKPKRGRKRAEEKDYDEEPSNKRPQLDTSESTLQPVSCTTQSASFPHSAIPFSAFPDDIESSDPWMAAASSFGTDNSDRSAQQGQELRWRHLDREVSPAGYPQSAVIPRGQRVFPSTEPKSAVTPCNEKPRSRRRHGPAVSSAWLSNSGASNGKTRGRPPSKGTVSGPFSSFPVNPIRTQQPVVNQQPDVKQPHRIIFDSESPYQQSPTPLVPTNVRPSKLQLQVPQHPGAPVRLATPPTLLVNGVDDSDRSHPEGENKHPVNGPSVSAGPNTPFQNDNKPGSRANLSVDDVIRKLSTELLGSKLIGRSAPLSSDEAQALASSMVKNLVGLYSKSPLGSPILMTALHLGQGHHFGFTEETPGPITINVNSSPSNHVEPSTLMDANNPSQTPAYTVSYEYQHPSHISTKVICSDIHIDNVGGVQPNNTNRSRDMLNNVSVLDDMADAEFEVDFPEDDMSDATWKQRYLKLRAQLQKKDRALMQYKRKILESVMADI